MELKALASSPSSPLSRSCTFCEKSPCPSRLALVASLPTGTDLDISTLLRLEYLEVVTKETRRHNRMFASNFFDNVTEPFTFAGFDIPECGQATGAIFRTMQDEAAYSHPERFEPERFLAPRCEHESQPNAYIAHGGGSQTGHRCPAEDLAVVLAQLAKMALSRRREFLADATAVEFTRYPEGLASALEKIGGDKTQLRGASSLTSEMFIKDPVKKNFMHSLFATHPPIEERVAALRNRT